DRLLPAAAHRPARLPGHPAPGGLGVRAGRGRGNAPGPRPPPAPEARTQPQSPPSPGHRAQRRLPAGRLPLTMPRHLLRRISLKLHLTVLFTTVAAIPVALYTASSGLQQIDPV